MSLREGVDKCLRPAALCNCYAAPIDFACSLFHIWLSRPSWSGPPSWSPFVPAVHVLPVIPAWLFASPSCARHCVRLSPVTTKILPPWFFASLCISFLHPLLLPPYVLVWLIFPHSCLTLPGFHWHLRLVAAPACLPLSSAAAAARRFRCGLFCFRPALLRFNACFLFCFTWFLVLRPCASPSCNSRMRPCCPSVPPPFCLAGFLTVPYLSPFGHLRSCDSSSVSFACRLSGACPTTVSCPSLFERLRLLLPLCLLPSLHLQSSGRFPRIRWLVCSDSRPLRSGFLRPFALRLARACWRFDVASPPAPSPPHAAFLLPSCPRSLRRY